MTDPTDAQWWVDPYGVGIVEVYGQRVAVGHPDTTDDQRAAEGRPTVAATREALAVENAALREPRDSAVEVGDVGALVIADTALPITMLEERLRTTTFAVWAEGDVVHIGWRGDAEFVEVIGSIAVVLHERAPALWSVSMKVRGLAEAVWYLDVYTQSGSSGDHTRFVGQSASRVADVDPGAVQCDALSIDAAANAVVSVYASPAQPCELLVLVGDGEDVSALAGALSAQVDAATLPGVVIAGVHSPTQDARAARLLPGADPLAYAAHRVALFDVIAPELRATYGVTGCIVLAGFSQGAAWALDTAGLEPSVHGVYAFAPTALTLPAERSECPVVLGHGTLDTFQAPATIALAEQLRARDGLLMMYTPVTGHDWFAYVRGFPDALRALGRAVLRP